MQGEDCEGCALDPAGVSRVSRAEEERCGESGGTKEVGILKMLFFGGIAAENG